MNPKKMNKHLKILAPNDNVANGKESSPTYSQTCQPALKNIRKASNCSTASSSTHEGPKKMRHTEKSKALLSASYQEKNQFTFEGRLFSPFVTYFENDLNLIFAEDENKFLGVFKNDEYIVKRAYLSGQVGQKRLYYTRIDPYGNPKANICIIHGFAEHSGRYIDFVHELAINGFIVHLIDLTGFGNSGGSLINDPLGTLHGDIEELLLQVDKGLPLFLLGQSLGAGLLISFLLRNPSIPVAGVITTSALINIPPWRKQISLTKRILGSLFGDLCGELQINEAINPCSLTKNNYNVKKWIDDPLSQKGMCMKLGINVLNLIGYVNNNMDNFEHPLLIIHGKEDLISPVESAEKLFQRVKSLDKTIKIFENGYHQMHYDTESSAMRNFILRWCLARIPTAKAYQGIKRKVKKGVPGSRWRANLFTVANVLLILIFLKSFKIFDLRNIFDKLIKYCIPSMSKPIQITLFN